MSRLVMADLAVCTASGIIVGFMTNNPWLGAVMAIVMLLMPEKLVRPR